MKLPVVILAALGLGLIGLSQTLFTVDERQQAIVLQFGNPVDIVQDAGLHVKVPFVQQVEYYERRILDVDPPAERVLLASEASGSSLLQKAVGEEEALTSAMGNQEVSGEPIMVDTFARYVIEDPLKFRQRLGSENAARNRLMREMNSTTRDLLGTTTLNTLLSSERQGLMMKIKERVNEEMRDLGITIVDIRIVRADLVASLRQSTVDRMISERQQRARDIRTIGEKEAEIIVAEARKTRDIRIAEAQEQSQILRGQGDREAIKIHADAYKKDSDFYAFYRSLEAYRNSVAKEQTQLILGPDSEFLNFLKTSR